jgi:hypothetical protein
MLKKRTDSDLVQNGSGSKGGTMSVPRKDKAESYPTIRRRWLAWGLANGENFHERSRAGRALRCSKAGQISAQRQRARGWPNLERAWAANRRKHRALQVLTEQKARSRELEKRRQILANSARETLGLRPVRGTASVNVLMPPRSALRRL